MSESHRRATHYVLPNATFFPEVVFISTAIGCDSLELAAMGISACVKIKALLPLFIKYCPVIY
jgi:hypothetical protein